MMMMRLRSIIPRQKRMTRLLLSTNIENNNNNNNNTPKETIFNVPNMLTLSRVALSGPLAYALYYDHYKLAFAGIAFGGVCDALDGYLARKWNQQTILGSFLDPAADKFMIASIVGTMAMKGMISTWLVALVIGRDALLLSGGFIYRWWTKPAGVPFFNTTYGASYSVKPTTLSKANTGVQLSLCAFLVTNPVFAYAPIEWTPYLEYLTGSMTVASGIQYAIMFGTLLCPVFYVYAYLSLSFSLSLPLSQKQTHSNTGTKNSKGYVPISSESDDKATTTSTSTTTTTTTPTTINKEQS